MKIMTVGRRQRKTIKPTQGISSGCLKAVVLMVQGLYGFAVTGRIAFLVSYDKVTVFFMFSLFCVAF